jgi:hypothetical protein
MFHDKSQDSSPERWLRVKYDREVQLLKESLDKGDATTFLPMADALAERDHPHATELCDLATTIATETDSTVVLVACLNFITILEHLS